MKILSVLAALLLLISCRGTKNAVPELTYKQPKPEHGEGITFVTFFISKDPKDKVTFSHYQTIHTEGQLKEPQIKLAENQVKYIIQLLDAGNEPLIEFQMVDVLNLSTEVFSENGTIEGHQTSLDQYTASFRFTTLKQAFSKAALFEVNSGKTELLQVIELK